MKTAIEKIKVTERIRKEITKIDELASDIKQNGLLNAITVMPLDGGEFRLLAGLRRMKAAQSLGWTEIEVNVVTPAGAEAALRIEISENEQREPFTFTERLDFGHLLEEIEVAKAKERMSEGGKGGLKEGVARGPHLGSGKSRNVIGDKIGMSGRQYDRAKFIAANASPDVIEQLDKGERTIRGTYDELRAKAKAERPSVPNIPMEPDPKAGTEPQTGIRPKPQSESPAPKPPYSNPRISNIRPMESTSTNRPDLQAMSPEDKIDELKNQLKAERARAAGAEFELTREKEQRQNEMYHYNATIEMLKNQLNAANTRIQELEAKYESV